MKIFFKISCTVFLIMLLWAFFSSYYLLSGKISDFLISGNKKTWKASPLTTTVGEDQYKKLHIYTVLPAYTATKDDNNTLQLYLSDEILEPKYYFGMQEALHSISNGTIYLHLAGNGGSVEGMLYIIDSLKNSGSKIIPIVDGDVASCHSILAFAFDNVPKFNGYGFVFLHAVSSTNEVQKQCLEDTLGSGGATDRGVSVYIKCLEDNNRITDIFNNIFLRTTKNITTNEEVKKIMAGHDIILSFDEVNQRLKNLERGK